MADRITLQNLKARVDKAKASAEKAKVLAYLSENTRPDEWYSSFKPICCATGLDRATVRRICRAFNRSGIAAFAAGLWSDDGTPAGSGYAITRPALAALFAQEGGRD